MRGKTTPKSKKRTMVSTPGERKEGRTLRIRLGRLLFAAPLLLVAGLVWASLQVPRLFTQSDSFRLNALEVEGLRVMSGVDILEASGLKVGDNIFAVDLGSVEERLEWLPWVKRALVKRRPPNRLMIDIVERRRLAWIDLGEIYGIDSEGVLLPDDRGVRGGYRDLDLPVISGLNCAPDSLYPGAVVADSTLGEILDWWRQASAVDAEFCMNVSEIQPLTNRGIRLRLVGDGLEVRLPADSVAERVRMLKKMMKRVYRECPDPAYIDMRFAGQVVVGSKERGSG